MAPSLAELWAVSPSSASLCLLCYIFEEGSERATLKEIKAYRLHLARISNSYVPGTANDNHLLSLFYPGSVRPYIQPRTLVASYDILKSPQHDRKSQPSVGNGNETVATERFTSSLPSEPLSPQTPAVTTMSSSSGSVMNSSNFVPPDALRNVPLSFSDSGTPVHDPPPVYQG